MCKVERKDSPDFSTVVTALRKHSQDASRVIKAKNESPGEVLNTTRRRQAMELVGEAVKQSPLGSSCAGKGLLLNGLAKALKDIGFARGHQEFNPAPN